jgi:hypothetical protein
MTDVQKIAQLTDIQKAAVAREAQKSVTSALKRYSRRALAGYLILLVGLGFAINGNHTAINDSHERAIKLRTVICLVLTQSDQGLYIDAEEGKIDRKELTAALTESAKFRKEIGPAPGCLTTLTPRAVPVS